MSAEESTMKHYTTFVSTGLIHVNLIDQVLRGRLDNMNKQTRTEAVRLYLLASMFPSLPSGILLALVQGEDSVRLERKSEDEIELYVDAKHHKEVTQ